MTAQRKVILVLFSLLLFRWMPLSARAEAYSPSPPAFDQSSQALIETPNVGGDRGGSDRDAGEGYSEYSESSSPPEEFAPSIEEPIEESSIETYELIDSYATINRWGHSPDGDGAVQSAQSAQPLPEPEYPPAPPEPPAPTEYENLTTIAISGARLKTMMELGADMVPFARQGVQVWLPVSLLETLNLADQDLFALSIRRLSEYSLHIDMQVNAKSLAAPLSESYEVGILWQDNEFLPDCANETGELVPVSYDAEQGLLVIELDTLGSVSWSKPVVAAPSALLEETLPLEVGQIAEIPTSQPQQADYFPLLPALIFLAVFAGSILFRRFRRVP